MEHDILITGIDRVIAGQKSYPLDGVLDYSGAVTSNELIIHLGGTCTVQYDDQTLLCAPGTVRFLPKNTGRVYRVYRQSSEISYVDIYFQSDRPLSATAFCMDFTDNRTVEALFKKIFTVWTARGSGYRHECLSLLYKILSDMEKNTGFLPSRKYSHIEPAVTYIQAHFADKKITASTLEQLCDVSYSYIKRLFSEKFGVYPETYILQLKINFACDLLSSRQYSVAQVAQMTGFSDTAYFSRCFKQHMGLSPLKYQAGCER